MLSDDQYSGTTPLESQNKALELCNQFGDQARTASSPSARPTPSACWGRWSRRNWPARSKFIGFDPGPQLVPALAEGKIHGLVLQDPVAMGYQSVKMLVAHLRGEQVEKRVVTGEVMATPENMHEPAIKKLLEPEQAD